MFLAREDLLLNELTCLCLASEQYKQQGHLVACQEVDQALLIELLRHSADQVELSRDVTEDGVVELV